MAASADHVTALVKAHAAGDDEGFYSVARQLAARAARQGQTKYAAELRDLIDAAKARELPRAGPTPVIQPRGELAELVTATYPDVRLADMTLAPDVRQRLERVLREQRQRDRIEHRGFTPIHRLLLVGLPGTGKSMTASVLAHDLSLPLLTIRLDGVISRFMGETASKLRLVFDAAAKTRAVYLFDEFDALGAERRTGNDVGEARRILNTFLLFLDDAPPESLVVAATNHHDLLDSALFRRFDSVISYGLPNPDEAVKVLRRRLATMSTEAVDWTAIPPHVGHLSHAELVRAAEGAAKAAILGGSEALGTGDLITALDDRRAARHE
jgi:SpoVK/Ycf46/Vps4 family AAA+-type ATPase